MNPLFLFHKSRDLEGLGTEHGTYVSLRYKNVTDLCTYIRKRLQHLQCQPDRNNMYELHIVKVCRVQESTLTSYSEKIICSLPKSTIAFEKLLYKAISIKGQPCSVQIQ